MTQADVQSLLAKKTVCHERSENTMTKKALSKTIVIVCVQNMQTRHVTSVRKTAKKIEMIRIHCQSLRFQGIVMKNSCILLQLNALMIIHHEPQKKSEAKIH